MSYDGRGAQFDIIAVESNDLAFTVTAVDTASAPVDLSAATITATVYNFAGTALDKLATVLAGDGSNVITLSFTDTEVDALVDPESWALVVERGGDARTWLAGAFTVSDAATVRAGTSGMALTATVDSDVSVAVTVNAIGGITTGIDGGTATSNYGGTTAIDGGSA